MRLRNKAARLVNATITVGHDGIYRLWKPGTEEGEARLFTAGQQLQVRITKEDYQHDPRTPAFYLQDDRCRWWYCHGLRGTVTFHRENGWKEKYGATGEADATQLNS